MTLTSHEILPNNNIVEGPRQGSNRLEVALVSGELPEIHRSGSSAGGGSPLDGRSYERAQGAEVLIREARKRRTEHALAPDLLKLCDRSRNALGLGL
jgi:hypothetical protein